MYTVYLKFPSKMRLQMTLIIYLNLNLSYCFNYRNYLEDIDIDLCKKIIKPCYNEGDIHLTEMLAYEGVLYHAYIMIERKEFDGFVIGSMLKDLGGPRITRMIHKPRLFVKAYNWTFGEIVMLLEIKGTIMHLWNDVEYMWKRRYIYDSQADPWPIINYTLSELLDEPTEIFKVPTHGWRHITPKKAATDSNALHSSEIAY